VSPGIGFGEFGDDYVRFSLIENEHRTRQAVRGIRRALGGARVGETKIAAARGWLRRRARRAPRTRPSPRLREARRTANRCWLDERRSVHGGRHPDSARRLASD